MAEEQATAMLDREIEHIDRQLLSKNENAAQAYRDRLVEKVKPWNEKVRALSIQGKAIESVRTLALLRQAFPQVEEFQVSHCVLPLHNSGTISFANLKNMYSMQIRLLTISHGDIMGSSLFPHYAQLHNQNLNPFALSTVMNYMNPDHPPPPIIYY